MRTRTSTTHAMRATTVLALAALATPGCSQPTHAAAHAGTTPAAAAPGAPTATDLGSVLAAVAAHPPATDSLALAVLTAPPPAHGMTAFAMPEGRALWHTDDEVDARPWIAGDVVVTHVGGRVVAYDARTGQVRFRHSDEGFSLVGAAGDAGFVAITLGRGDLRRREGVTLVLDATNGDVRYESRAEQAPAVPAAGGGYAFVPLDGQFISVIDAARGSEVQRVRISDDVVSRVTVAGGVVFYGSQHLSRLTPAGGAVVADATATADGGAPATPASNARPVPPGSFALAREDLPGNPSLLPDGYAAPPAGVNARERVALALRPDPAAERNAPVDGTVYSLFHRVVFALDAATGALRWTRLLDSDIAGTQVVRGALVVVTEAGNALWLDASHGNIVVAVSLGTPTAQAVLSLPAEVDTPRGQAETDHPLADELLEVARSRDARLVPARAFALKEAAGIAGEHVTGALIEIAGDDAQPAAVRAAAGEALATRTDGIGLMLTALGTHYDFLRGTRAPPVGYLARALGHAHERRAVPLLLSHLRDPDTPVADLAPIVAALQELRDPSAAPGLLQFLEMYHADTGAIPPLQGNSPPVDELSADDRHALDAALGAAAEAVARLGGAPARTQVQAVLSRSNTVPAVREVCEHALAPAPAAHTETAATEPAHAEPEAPALPERLTPEMIRAAFRPVRERLVRCFGGTAPGGAPVRVRFEYDGQGAVSNVVVTPVRWSACMSPIIARIHVPTTQVRRAMDSFFLNDLAPANTHAAPGARPARPGPAPRRAPPAAQPARRAPATPQPARPAPRPRANSSAQPARAPAAAH